MTCKLQYNNTKLVIYGLTQNTETNEYMMVFQHASDGSLYKYIRKNFSELTWQNKLQILYDISDELENIHIANYIHADFHSGNILQDQHTNENVQSYIADLGLSRKNDECVSGDIYGVMPYVAPEVLSGETQFTQKADIFGFGIVMAEITTGQRPLDGYEFNKNLAIKIWKGLRPEFAPGTPSCYMELAKQCMNSDPEKRPSSKDLRRKLDEWNNIMKSLKENGIKKQFLEADKIAGLPKNQFQLIFIIRHTIKIN